MRKIRCFAVVLAALVLWSAVGADSPGEGGLPRTGLRVGQAGSMPAEHASLTRPIQPAPATQPAMYFDQIRRKAFKQLLKGRFSEGAALLDAAWTIQADDSVARARALTNEYLKIRQKADAERKAEFDAAVRHVRMARLAEKYRPELVKAKLPGKVPDNQAENLPENLAEKLWDNLKDIVDDVSSADELITVDSTSRPAKVREEAFKHMDSATEKIASACESVTDREGDWPDAFRASADRLRNALAGYRKAWRSANRSNNRRVLKTASEKVQDALIDISVLVSRKPLTAALGHAREAKKLTDDSESLGRQEWIRRLIRDADKRGKELIDNGKWVDALMIYGSGGLTGLDEDSVAFKDMLKKANRHVRMINIYGGNGLNRDNNNGNSSKPQTTKPANGDGSDSSIDQPRWRDMIVRIDTAMVRDAIEQIDDNYVKEPDHRKIGIAGLNAVRILIETKQAGETLKILKDEKKRKAFLESIDGQIKYLRGIRTVDQKHVKDALHHILDSNAETLEIPPEIIDMEFAEGMLTALDRFTSMIWPYQIDDFRKHIDGAFTGVGIKIRKEPGKPIEVVTPLLNSPALRAGIRAGDYIVRVNGKKTETMMLERAVKLITGKKGTTVTLTIRRTGRSKPFKVPIKRDTIRIRTIKGWRRLPNGSWDFFIDPAARIGYVRLTQFTLDSPGELRRALREISHAKPPARGVILDLRFNPGGHLRSAVRVSDEFLKRGLIVRTKGRNRPEEKRNATPQGEFQRGQVVVLVNQYSASASEIVAGALKDWGRAWIVGQRTYGKGSVQEPWPRRRPRLKLTTGYYYLPSGRCLHRTNGAKVWGVDPDIPVMATARQTSRWLEISQETDLLKSVDAGKLSKLLSEQLREDIHLQTALLLLRLKLLSETKPAPAAKAA